jgi:endopeptidase Clp ATP-binding regulatory subunit ClpX
MIIEARLEEGSYVLVYAVVQALWARSALLRICAFCATRALAEITPQPVPEPAPPPERPSKEALLASIPSPKTLVANLDQYVIGQDIAKRRIALGVSNHFKRIVDTWDCGAPDPIVADADLQNVRIEKSNILLIGPSGSGKTHLVKSLASYLNVPLVIGDATSLTEAGYVGDDVESLLSKLILTAEGDIEAAQRGIVYIDEIDKIKTTGSGFKDLRLGVQHALLKLIEGSVTTVPSVSGGAGSDSVRYLKTARWLLMGCCARSSRKTSNSSG